MRAEVDVKSSARQDLAARLVERKGLLDRWARRWRVNVRAVATAQESASIEPSQGTVVFKPYASTPIASSATKKIASMFGYALPEADDARTRLSPSSNAQPFLSPEANRVAQAQPGVFSFLVNVLGHDWEGAEEVANIVFACTLPKTLPEGHVRKRAKRLREVLRRKLRRDKKRTLAAYVPLVRQGLQEFIDRHGQEIRETTERMAEKERERIALFGEISEIEEYLAHTEAHIKSRAEIEREFEQILRMQGVAIVRVESEYSSDGKVPVITVYTDRIEQEHEGTRYDIGSFRIKIDPSKLVRESVRYVQDFPGDFIHPHALPAQGGAMGAPATAICFGSDAATGLNNPINKLMADFDIVPLVHLLLTFLRLDNQKPQKNESVQRRPAEEATRLTYSSAEDRAKECAAFAKIVSDVLMPIMTQKSRARLKELQEKEAAAAKEYYTARRERNELRERVKLLRERLTALPGPARAACARLLVNPDVLYARVFEKSLQVWFWNPKTASIHMVWLDPKRSPWIIGYEKLDAVSSYHAFETSDEKFKRRALKCLASGKLTQAAELIIGRILGSAR